MKRKFDHDPASGDRIAWDLLEWLASDEDRLLRFLQATGLSPETVGQSARDPGFLAAVLDFVMDDETTLLACAEALGQKPEAIAVAWRRLQPPDFDHAL